MKEKKEYKNSLFQMIFQEKKYILELYQLLYKTNLTKEEQIKIISLEDILFVPKKNDLVFLAENKCIFLLEESWMLFESMPVRFLFYIARVYEKMMEVEHLYYSGKFLLPIPECIILYHGKENLYENQKIVREKRLKFSDSFPFSEEVSSLELSIRVIDIRCSSQHEILQEKNIIQEYSKLYEIIEECYQKENEVQTAVKQAIEISLEQGILIEFLTHHKENLASVLTIEYREAFEKKIEQEQVWNAGMEQGVNKGRKEEKEKVTIQMIKIGLNDFQIAKCTGLSLQEIERLRLRK